jgi:hypothetical protein
MCSGRLCPATEARQGRGVGCDEVGPWLVTVQFYGSASHRIGFPLRETGAVNLRSGQHRHDERCRLHDICVNPRMGGFRTRRGRAGLCCAIMRRMPASWSIPTIKLPVSVPYYLRGRHFDCRRIFRQLVKPNFMHHLQMLATNLPSSISMACDATQKDRNRYGRHYFF